MRTPNLSLLTPEPFRGRPARGTHRQRATTQPSVETRRIAARELQRRRGFRKAHYISRHELYAQRPRS